jgi:hypothetical protein
VKLLTSSTINLERAGLYLTLIIWQLKARLLLGALAPELSSRKKKHFIVPRV